MKQFSSIVALAFILAITGCQHDRHGRGHEDHDHGDTKEQTISMNDVPAPVRSGFEKANPGAKVKKVERETYADGTIHYEFEFTTADGKEQEVEFDASGEQLDAH